MNPWNPTMNLISRQQKSLSEIFSAPISLPGLVKRLERPTGPVDVVLDTDAFNEIDDQFAIAYMMKRPDKLRVQAIYAAPFFNDKSTSPKDGMEKSHAEILRLLELMGRGGFASRVFPGSPEYLPEETIPVDSPAARDLAERAMNYTPESPLYVAAIGAITNIASALLLNPAIRDRIVILWLGGHSLEWTDCMEFNLIQDVAAARVIFGCGAALVQAPCNGVVSTFTVSGPELTAWLPGKNPLCDHLYDYTMKIGALESPYKAWSRVIWDVVPLAWLLEPDYTETCLIPSPIPEYDGFYATSPSRHLICYIREIHRDTLMENLMETLTGEKLV